jgi:sugar lactone lactonase YvrE
MIQPILSLDRASMFYDGIFTEPRLRNPEGVAVDREGHVWCGGSSGEIYRIWRDGSHIELIASTEGFVLGLAFDDQGYLYICDIKHACVFRLHVESRHLDVFATGDETTHMRIPNFPVVDLQRGCLYVSDSYDGAQAGPGIWRFDLKSGKGGLWYDQPLVFANGLALDQEGATLYVVETFAQRISRIPIKEDGSAGEKQVFVPDLPAYPDGLAFDEAQNLYIGCYEPSRLYRVDPTGQVELLIHDPAASLLCHPANCAFRGTTLFTSNLGRWHITQIDLEIKGLRLPC